MRLRFVFPLACCAARLALADGEPRQVLSFSVSNDVGFGRSVFVVGGHPDLGNWAPVDAVKLRYTSGNIWTGRVAVRAGETVGFKYISRLDTSNTYCIASNVIWLSPANLAVTTTPLTAAPYEGKTLFYYTGWTQAFVLASTDGASFVDLALERAGPGRTGGEYLYRGTNVGGAGRSLEFVLHDGAGHYDHAPYAGHGVSNYFTRLDAFVLQDGEVYSYWPAPSVSGPRIVNTNAASTVAEITGRGVRIYLPRGYNEHTWKRYPVFYFQDGTNVFDPGSANGSWAADRTATREISQGRMRETILVAVDNIPTYRRTEYEPPGDTYVGETPGIADKYLKFLLGNVRPMLDVNYRTLTDARNTMVGGSSMGGLFSLYAGYETNVFGALLAMSPAVTRAPNFSSALAAKSKQPLRIYEDIGSSEGQVGTPPGGDYWGAPWGAYDTLLAQGYGVNDDLLMRVGCGQAHNEAAWSNRLSGAFAFLLDAREEPSPVLLQQVPPRMTASPLESQTVQTLRRHAYRLEQASNLLGAAWTRLATSPVENLPWGRVDFTNPAPSSGAAYQRFVAEPRP